jgi:hypothetical protein
MPGSVRDLRDLPLLYVVKGEDDMGAPKKTRAELLDKIIQFIWDYQDRHGGDTPQQNVVARHVGVDPGGIGYYIAILVDEGRLNKISPRPFRVTITDHKDNQKAIDRFKRIRERLERADALERDRIREEQGQLRETEQRETDRSAALALVAEAPAPASSDTVVVERPAIARNWDRQLQPPAAKHETEDRLDQFTDAHARVREINKEVKAMMPKLLKITDERDLVFELVSRGYRVDKVR